jgi:hypothetical protein
LAIADAQIPTWEERVFTTVKGSNALIVLGPGDTNHRVSKDASVKSMQRISQFKHHVVGAIDDIVDGTHTHRLESLTYPRRRRTYRDIADYRARVSGTAINGTEFNLDAVVALSN